MNREFFKGEEEEDKLIVVRRIASDGFKNPVSLVL